MNQTRLHPPVAALILAAGRSSRMGGRNKLLLRDSSGQTMIGRVVEEVLASQVSEAVVVTGHQAEEVARAACLASSGSHRLRIIRAVDFAVGMSASLKAGLRVLSHATAALVCLGDMPLVTSATMDRLIEAYDPQRGKTIIVPTFQGLRGNPVLWDGRFFSAIAGLSGDQGARGLLKQHTAELTEVACHHESVLRDFDTPDMLIEGWENPSD